MCQKNLKTYKVTTTKPSFFLIKHDQTIDKGNKNKLICTFNNSEDVTIQFKILKYNYVNYKILINYIIIIIIIKHTSK